MCYMTKLEVAKITQHRWEVEKISVFSTGDILTREGRSTNMVPRASGN